MRTLITLLLVIILLSSNLANAGEATGVDSILESVGLDKPTDWGIWEKPQKHKYLQDRGIYPASGEKYEGNANISRFFTDYLKVERPSNWESLTFKQKKEFVETSINPDTIPNSNPPINKPTTNPTLYDDNYDDDHDEEEKEEHEDEYDDDDNIKITNTNQESTTNTTNSNSLITRYPIFILIPIILAVLIIISSLFNHGSKIKKSGMILTYYILPVILIILAIMFPERQLFRDLGDIAEYFLILILFIKPIAVLFSSKTLMKIVSYRRTLGIACFWYFVVHMIGLIILLNLKFLDIFTVSRVFFCVLAAIGLFLLAITSNNISMRILKRNWKRVQYLAYPALFATLAHTSIATTGKLTKLYIIGGFFIIIKTLEWSKFKIIKPKPVNNSNQQDSQ